METENYERSTDRSKNSLYLIFFIYFNSILIITLFLLCSHIRHFSMLRRLWLGTLIKGFKKRVPVIS